MCLKLGPVELNCIKEMRKSLYSARIVEGCGAPLGGNNISLLLFFSFTIEPKEVPLGW